MTKTAVTRGISILNLIYPFQKYQFPDIYGNYCFCSFFSFNGFLIARKITCVLSCEKLFVGFFQMSFSQSPPFESKSFSLDPLTHRLDERMRVSNGTPFSFVLVVVAFLREHMQFHRFSLEHSRFRILFNNTVWYLVTVWYLDYLMKILIICYAIFGNLAAIENPSLQLEFPIFQFNGPCGKRFFQFP